MPTERAQKPPVTLKTADLSRMSEVERIKVESKGLFYVSSKGEVHKFLDEVAALESGERPTISTQAKELSKFFGVYKQQVRDARGSKSGDYIFMVRIKNPAGGELSAEQWAALDDAADLYGDGTLRITSRQGIQYHRVHGPKLAPLIRHLNRNYRKEATLGACGDLNRNTMTSPIDGLEPGDDSRGRELAHAIAEELAPKSSAYFQIWVSNNEGQKIAPLNPDEPIYGAHYLPRKFKVGLAHARDNSVDVLTQDVGFVPVVTNGSGAGTLWDFYAGGGMGLTHNNAATAPLLAMYLGRIRRDQVVEGVRAIAILQKENGERRDRKLARWKYTIRRLGLEAVKAQLRDRFHLAIEETTPQPLPPLQLHLGWHPQRDRRGYYGISVENGRLRDGMRKAVRAAIEELDLGVRLTPQQDILLCNVPDRGALERILDAHGVPRPNSISLVRRNAMACPAKPTCGLAMTEAENILPSYIDAIEAAGFGDIDAVIRMTGCPNNCVRPPTAEIGIYGYGKNDHVILVGGSRAGTRLARALYSRVPEQKMVPLLVGLFSAMREHNTEGLTAGDFLDRCDPSELRAWIGIEDGA